jgi:NAD(P)-dependent dehydrogenase (short-subunit alcohol dehydrogenase family)
MALFPSLPKGWHIDSYAAMGSMAMIAVSPETIEGITATADISKEDELAQAFAAITAKFGTLDVLIHNAAYFRRLEPHTR